ncbi:hypothetical protein AQUCO_00300030v1 [Aquilegia coerulea]|uniref:Protein phosphatase n=1 Tax=Aquilegia coerulea TaxID=218851 RepID=A0A2G5EWV8_AQUCA|nr:hypothetical protein AQUCO_00300030v1 [Aquilegia coerulea]
MSVAYIPHVWSSETYNHHLQVISSSLQYCSSSRPILRDISERSLRLVSGSFYLPKESKTHPKGQDSHFICEEEQTIGVADGVGGWIKHGIDSGEYSRELMFNSVLAVKTQPHAIVDPENVLNSAYLNTKAEGASTASIITLRHQMLHAVNIGDSGFRIYRGGKCIYRSPVQQRGFNCPYQLGNATKCDSPNLAEVLEVPTEDGDIVVAGTDGLFDNMFDSEIEEQLKKGIEDGLEAHQMACNLADLALYNSFDRYTLSPFAMEARKAGVKHQGGKIDDITVIVAYIVS